MPPNAAAGTEEYLAGHGDVDAGHDRVKDENVQSQVRLVNPGVVNGLESLLGSFRHRLLVVVRIVVIRTMIGDGEFEVEGRFIVFWWCGW